MILRVIRGLGDRGRIAALRADLIARLGPGPVTVDGPDRYHLGRRAGIDLDDVLLVACWPSAEAAAAGDARGVSALELARRFLDNVDVAHFEVDVNVLRAEHARPTALRIATGRFSRPGADIQMQQLLRDRLPAVGPEMLEAYVGRRVVGRAVDVAFVSTWEGRSGDLRLHETFWPDISLQYDTFTVEVYAAVD